MAITRRETTIESLKTDIQKSLGYRGDVKIVDALAEHVEVVRMEITNPDDYKALKRRLDELEKKSGICFSRLYYLAIPSQMFGPVVDFLGQNDLSGQCTCGERSARLLIEKPFGYDLESAQELEARLGRYFQEEQIFRIDHYLAKETAQNILTFRAHNPVYGAVWNKEHVSHIMITASEEIGIEGRASFYDSTGALRDFVQNHLLQLLTLTTMELPKSIASEYVHEQKRALLQAVEPIHENEVQSRAVRGQYVGYTSEAESPKSITETYAALALSIDNDRWRGVPMLLRTGKALTKKMIEITLVFKPIGEEAHSNMLTIRIQPNEGISLNLYVKKPGFARAIESVEMDFSYIRSFSGNAPDAYERVLVDAMRGDRTLFTTGEEVLISWKIVQAVIDTWQKDGRGLEGYAQGSWGPKGADALAQRFGATWTAVD
jgi:glucose-6-phosphate 1-dehydrogenase